MTYTDLFVLLGAPASLMACVPLLYSGAIVLEKHMRREAQTELSAYLLATDDTHARRLDEATLNVFTATFGKSQFSLNSIQSSLYVSLSFSGVMILISLIAYRFFPFVFAGCVFIIPFALIFGFISSAKTRFLLNFSISFKFSILLAIFVDFLASWVLSFLAFQSWTILGNFVFSIENSTTYGSLFELGSFQNAVFDYFLSNNLFSYLINFFSGRFDLEHYATLDVPFGFLGTVISSCMAFSITIWLVLVVTALFAVRLLVPIRRLLTWGLAVDQNPLRAVAIAAITLLVVGSILINVMARILFN